MTESEEDQLLQGMTTEFQNATPDSIGDRNSSKVTQLLYALHQFLLGYAQMLGIVKINTVSSISELTSFTRGNTISIFVSDPIKGGTFYYYPSGYSVDNGIVFSAQGGGYWVRKVENWTYRLDWWSIDLTGNSSQASLLTSILNGLPTGSTMIFPSNKSIMLAGNCIITNSVSLKAEYGFKIKGSGTPSSILTLRNLYNIEVDGLEIYKADNTNASNLLFFDNCEKVTVTRNKAYNSLNGILFTKCRYVHVEDNIVTDTQNSGIRLNKNGDTDNDGCQHIRIWNNYLARNVLGTGTGNGAIFIGVDGGSSPHKDIHIFHNTCEEQGQMCVGADGKILDLTIDFNTLRQTGTKGEVIAAGGGLGADGMKRLRIANNYVEQNIGKTDGGCILLYSNVTDADVVNNRTKGGPQGLFIHYPANDSYFENVNVRNNTFQDCNQGVLLLKNNGVVITTLSKNITIVSNRFDNVTTLSENSSLSFSELGYTMNNNYWNGSLYVSSGNLTLSAATLPEKNVMGFWNQNTATAKTVEGSIYNVSPANTSATTSVLIGATGLPSSPVQRFGGIQVTLSGTGYASARTSLVASNGATRKVVGSAILDTGDVAVFQLNGIFNGELLKIGSFYIWDDGAGAMRRKTSLPTTATDGTVF